MDTTRKHYQDALDSLETQIQINSLYCSDVCCTPNRITGIDDKCTIQGIPPCPQAEYLKIKSNAYQRLQQLIDTHFDTEHSHIPLTTMGLPTATFLSLLAGKAKIWVCGDFDVQSYTIDGFNYEGFYSLNRCLGTQISDIIFKPQDYNVYWFCTSTEAKQELVKRCTM